MTNEEIADILEDFGEPREGSYTDPRLNIPLDEMVLGVRGYNGLRSSGKTNWWGAITPGIEIECVGDAVRSCEKDLLRIPNFGRITLTELKDYLLSLGEPSLHLGMRPERSGNTEMAKE